MDTNFTFIGIKYNSETKAATAPLERPKLKLSTHDILPAEGKNSQVFSNIFCHISGTA
jgi:hypothetical protein